MPRSSCRRGTGRSLDPWNPLLAKVLKYLLASNKITAGGKLNLFQIIFETTTPESEVSWININEILQKVNIDNFQISDYTINPDTQRISAEEIVDVNTIIDGRGVKYIGFAPGYDQEDDDYFERFISKESVMDYDQFFLTMLPHEIDIILRLLNYYRGPDALHLAWKSIQQQFEILKRHVSAFIDVSVKRDYVFSVNRDYYEEYQRLEKLQEYYTHSSLRSGIFNTNIVEFNGEIVVDFHEHAGCTLPKWYKKNQSIYNLIASFLTTLNRVRQQTLPQIMSLIDGIPFEFLKSIIAASARHFKLLARNSPCTESSQCFPYDCNRFQQDANYCSWD
jgi:hypothetical protein